MLTGAVGGRSSSRSSFAPVVSSSRLVAEVVNFTRGRMSALMLTVCVSLSPSVAPCGFSSVISMLSFGSSRPSFEIITSMFSVAPANVSVPEAEPLMNAKSRSWMAMPPVTLKSTEDVLGSDSVTRILWLATFSSASDEVTSNWTVGSAAPSVATSSSAGGV